MLNFAANLLLFAYKHRDYMILLLAFKHNKCWKWRFQPAFGMRSTQTLVEIHNIYPPNLNSGPVFKCNLVFVQFSKKNRRNMVFRWYVLRRLVFQFQLYIPNKILLYWLSFVCEFCSYSSKMIDNMHWTFSIMLNFRM